MNNNKNIVDTGIDAFLLLDVISTISDEINDLISLLKYIFEYALNGEQMSLLVAQSGLAADKFQGLANAVKKYGGNAEEASKSVETLRKGFEDIKKGGNGDGLKETLSAFNINPAGLQSTDQLLEVIAGRMETLKSDTEKLDFGRALGLDGGTIKLLSGGVKEFNEELKKSSQYNAFSPEDIKNAEELNEALRDIENGFYSIGLSVTQFLLPVLKIVFAGIKNTVDFFAKNSEMIKLSLLGIVSVVTVALLPAVSMTVGVFSLLVGAILALSFIVGEFIQWIKGEESIFSGWLLDFEVLKEGLGDGFRQIGKNIVNFLGEARKFINAFVKGLWNALTGTFGRLVGFVQDIMAKVLEIIPDWLKNLLRNDTIVGMSVRLVDGAKSISKDGSHAAGLGYVPFDGYLAELHEGESVLSKSDANIWRDLQLGKDAINATAGVSLASIPQGAISNAYQNSDNNSVINIGDITVQTAAVDASGIASDLAQSIKMAFNGLDTGVKA